MPTQNKYSKLPFGVFYRSNKFFTINECINHFEEVLSQFKMVKMIYSNGTNSSGIVAYNFSLSQSLTQLVDFPTRFPDRDDQTPSLLDLFLSSNPNVCNASVLSRLGNSDHAVVNVDISLSSKAAQE